MRCSESADASISYGRYARTRERCCPSASSPPSPRRTCCAGSGQSTLSQWMADNARVCWIERSEPWDLESQLICQLDLPLNLDQNRHSAFHTRLKELRAQARQRARELPISS
ncbi:GIY-YIG nuclease family protein [Streptomyces sp. NPDC096105]|uniref:GIY-YIG nuclease family protein n=1 Tax=Streptomyces sp. NPDC096105 TaxID=3366074 RepID=UPI00380E4FD8